MSTPPSIGEIVSTHRASEDLTQDEYGTRYEVSDGEYSLTLDFSDLEDESQDLRQASAPPEAAGQALAILAMIWNSIAGAWQSLLFGV